MDYSNIRTGLVSISFRKVAACDLIEEVVKAGQQGIEWGGDVHVPHGDTAKAEQVARWTRDAGLESAAYGSYYRLAKRNLRIAFEYHGNSLTDSIDSAVELLDDLKIENLDSLWQPPNGQPEELCEESLLSILS